MKRLTLFLLFVLLTGCNRGEPAPTDRLSTCLPKFEVPGSLRIAISQFEHRSDETRVRIVAYAVAEPAQFALPVYYMSRGRWLIDEKERSYLLDAQCRQYNLHDRHDATGTDAPPDGRMTLKPGTSFETTLDFPPLPASTTHGVLVYGPHVIPFSILPAARD